jgi:hypothetical protein
MKKSDLMRFALLLGTAVAMNAHARDSFSIGINVGGYGFVPPAVYYAPPPVVYYPAPTRYYYEPVRTYYYAPPPAVGFSYFSGGHTLHHEGGNYYRNHGGYGGGYHGHHGRRGHRDRD